MSSFSLQALSVTASAAVKTKEVIDDGVITNAHFFYQGVSVKTQGQ